MYWDHRLIMDAREPQPFQSGTLILQGGPMVRVLITGTSSGIGLATALELARAGHQVYATMRNPARAPQLAVPRRIAGLHSDDGCRFRSIRRGLFRGNLPER